MNKKILLPIAAVMMFSSYSFAAQSLLDALNQNKKLNALYEAVKEAAGVDCVPADSFPSKKVAGPDGKMSVTHQVACFDPVPLNPTQLGQLFVTYYGDGENETSPVGAVIDIKFEVWK